MAYKIAVIIAFALGFACFYWDIYTHNLLEETQEKLKKEQENVRILLDYMHEAGCLNERK